MTNGTCHVGAENRARIDANEKRITEISQSINEMLEKLDESQKILLGKIEKIQDEFGRRLDHVSEKFAGRPTWATMFILTAMSSVCVGLIVYVTTH